jgi:hypothetical protein
MIQTDPKKRPLLPQINEQLASSSASQFSPRLKVIDRSDKICNWNEFVEFSIRKKAATKEGTKAM